VISDFRRGLNEIIAFLEYYAAQVEATDVSEQPISPIFKGQAVQFFLEISTLDRTDRLYRNVGNY
jgi:hypothetical protein